MSDDEYTTMRNEDRPAKISASPSANAEVQRCVRCGFTTTGRSRQEALNAQLNHACLEVTTYLCASSESTSVESAYAGAVFSAPHQTSSGQSQSQAASICQSASASPSANCKCPNPSMRHDVEDGKDYCGMCDGEISSATSPSANAEVPCKHESMWFCREIEVDGRMHYYCDNCGMSDDEISLQQRLKGYDLTRGIDLSRNGAAEKSATPTTSQPTQDSECRECTKRERALTLALEELWSDADLTTDKPRLEWLEAERTRLMREAERG